MQKIPANVIYSPANFAVLRTPFFPFKDVFKVDPKELLKDDAFVNAVFFASPSLVDEMEAVLNDQLNQKQQEKYLLTIYRYYLRACYRCTPFGLFAGISMASIGDVTAITLAPQRHYISKVRLDTHLLTLMAQSVVSDPNAYDSIKWYANNTLYEVGDKLRFIEYQVDQESRTHLLAHVDNSSYVQNVLSKAKHGATRHQLAAELVSSDITQQDALQFVDEMIGSCLLISDLEPLVTGEQYHQQLIEKLSKPFSYHHSHRIAEIVNRLQEYDELSRENKREAYRSIVGNITNAFSLKDKGKVLQCDLLKPVVHACVGDNVMKELNRAIVLLGRITDRPAQTNLEDFKTKFSERYESQERSLLEVLDSDTGIGFPVNESQSSDRAPLVDTLYWKEDSLTLHYQTRISSWNKFIIEKFQRAIRNGDAEIELLDEEVNVHLPNLATGDSMLPDSAYTLCSIFASSFEEINNDRFILHHEVTAGPSAVNFIGRFCHLDASVASLAEEALRKEESVNPDCVYAEIVHIPQARLGNILMRPALRRYEIPILTRPSVQEDYVIELTDLRVSVIHGRVVLRSKRLNKEVIPRLTTAHNFALNPVPVYRFLCELQFQDTKGALFWSWGILKEFPFLPRVRYNKTILSKATWSVDLDRVTPEKKIDETGLALLISNYFIANKIPEVVTLSQGDNQLPMDIRNLYCRKILAQELKRNKSIVLQECLFEENNLVVNGPEGLFTNEIVVPWHKGAQANRIARVHFPARRFGGATRTFHPGTEWHYVKIYCSVKTADVILTEIIKPLVEELLENRTLEKFFFIRYYDRDHHLRVRFRGVGSFFSDVIKKLDNGLKPAVENNLVFNIQIESYNREIERYGGENIENTETIFFIDSIATLKILSVLEGDEGDHLRWQFAMKGVNDLMDAFNFSLAMKIELMQVLSASFAKEFNADNQESRKQLSSKFRSYRHQIEIMFEESISEEHEFYPVWQVFANRKYSLLRCADEIYKLSAKGVLTVSVSDLVSSYVHMFLNRFLRSRQRMHEMVIYDLLLQYFKSAKAREKTL